MWASVAQCKAVATKFNISKVSLYGNSLNARNYHAGIASSQVWNRYHCQHSALNGKESCTDSAIGPANNRACDSFCEQSQRICSGSLGQYTNMIQCVRSCLALPNVTEAPYPSSGDSLQCRFHHLQEAATSDAMAQEHCAYTGLYDDSGVCGSVAESMCDLSLTACNSTSMVQYSSRDQCISATTAFPRDSIGTLAVPVVSGNSLECRLYHAQLAIQSTALANEHCYYTGALGGAGMCGSACSGFCSTVMTACSGLSGGGPFITIDLCMTHCATWPIGDLTTPTIVTSGNSLACRAYHASAALAGNQTIKAIHCPHAAALSGYSNGSPTCGTYCESYCNTIQAACTGNLTLFSSTTQCLSTCSSYATYGSVGDHSGSTVQCRAEHAELALIESTYAMKQTHCGHAKKAPTSFCVVNSVRPFYSAVSWSCLVIASTIIAAMDANKNTVLWSVMIALLSLSSSMVDGAGQPSGVVFQFGPHLYASGKQPAGLPPGSFHSLKPGWIYNNGHPSKHSMRSGWEVTSKAQPTTNGFDLQASCGFPCSSQYCGGTITTQLTAMCCPPRSQLYCSTGTTCANYSTQLQCCSSESQGTWHQLTDGPCTYVGPTAPISVPILFPSVVSTYNIDVVQMMPHVVHKTVNAVPILVVNAVHLIKSVAALFVAAPLLAHVVVMSAVIMMVILAAIMNVLAAPSGSVVLVHYVADPSMTAVVVTMVMNVGVRPGRKKPSSIRHLSGVWLEWLYWY
jgi:hypothetical protein